MADHSGKNRHSNEYPNHHLFDANPDRSRKHSTMPLCCFLVGNTHDLSKRLCSDELLALLFRIELLTNIWAGKISSALHGFQVGLIISTCTVNQKRVSSSHRVGQPGWQTLSRILVLYI